MNRDKNIIFSVPSVFSVVNSPVPARMRSTWAILTITGLGAFIAALDQTVVVTALPSVMLDLKIPITELDRVSWIITAYLLGYTVAMPLIGRLGDVYGYPRVYQASLIVFCIGTSLVAVAPNFEWMIGARVIQAIGGGGTVPIGMALAVSLVPAGAPGAGPGRGRRGSRGWLHAGPGLRRSHRRAVKLALDILAQRAPGCGGVRRHHVAARLSTDSSPPGNALSAGP